MKFTEIFNKFESHSYIRRESWSEDTFIQLRSTANLIRLVNFEIGKTPYTLDNDVRLTAEDLLADDWLDIEDLMPKEPVKPTTFWDYVDTLEDGSDDWRYAMQLGQKLHNEGKNPDEYLEEIIKKVNKK
jgi:hypothetical protein